MPTDDLHSLGAPEIAFGPFRLYPQQRLLFRADTPLRLGSRAREILVTLVEHAGEVVKKRELIGRVWPDSIVEEGSLRVHVAALRKALGDGGEAGIRYVENVNGHGYRFIAPLTRLDEAPPAPIERPPTVEHPHTMPSSLTRVVGRGPVIDTLASCLPYRRLVTIVGPGGIGKTTVALATANHLHDAYSHGVCFIDLAAIGDPLLISGTVASALGLTTVSEDPVPRVIEFLKSKRMLIVLNNCEHVIEGAALIAEKLVGGAPGVDVIATSRESLRAKGEWVLRLDPMELPPRGAVLSAAEAMRFSAVELFVERALASLDTFELSDADVPAVVEICHQLDGLPLAIELAAARVDLFGIGGLASRLDDRLGLLTRGHRTAMPRHQTLRATLDWSYELLSGVEQRVLRRLAVFAGAFDLRSASAVVVDDEVNEAGVSDVLTNLASKSLLTVQAAGEQVLHRLLSTSRAYALEKLEISREGGEIKRRHAQLCRSWGKDDLDWEPQSFRQGTAGSGYRIDDVRAALNWCCSLDGDSRLGIELTATSAPIWFQSSFLNEYRGRLEWALQALKSNGIRDATLELRLNAALGNVTLFTRGPSPLVTAAFNKTLELAEQLGTNAHRQRALWGLWAARIGVSDYQSALGFAQAFCLFANSAGDRSAMLEGDRMMALAHHFLGDQSQARRHAERALTRPGRPVSAWSDCHFQFEHRVASQAALGRILWVQGFPDQATRVNRETLECAQATGHSLSLCLAVTCICTVALWTGDLSEARRCVTMLLDESNRHSLGYWQAWGRCLEIALGQRIGEQKPHGGVLSDPLYRPLHYETLATLCVELPTEATSARAESGHSGWCAAEILRVKAETLLRTGGGTAAAEGLLQQSLSIATKQGALSWELRTATSLARLWHGQRRTRRAHGLLASVLARFTEGFDTTDLVNAKTLLEQMTG
jgi:predicted ATPase/DNA-binding winged helix-turn-helix (wHTH) protein